MSAKFSYRALNLFVLRMERKERMLLVINISMASVVISSIIVVSCSFSTFSEVSTRKQNPRRFDEVLSICCEFPFLEFLLSESLFITFFCCVFSKQKLLLINYFSNQFGQVFAFLMVNIHPA
jgi:hypothetical protein